MSKDERALLALELRKLRVPRCIFPLLRCRLNFIVFPRCCRLDRLRLSIAQAMVNNDSQLGRASEAPADQVCREKVSLTASCNALPVASRSGRAKAGLQASSLVRSLIRKTGRLDTFEDDRLGVEINHRIKGKC